MNMEVSKKEIEAYAQRPLPPGWRLLDKCNMEKCPKTGRYHYQAMLKTPQVRKTAVIKAMAKAHVEKVYKSDAALENYVQKSDTRVASIDSGTPTVNIYEYQSIIAKKWRDDTYRKWQAQFPRKDKDDVAMLYLDSLVATDISEGRRGAEWHATNPLWRSAWKKFWREIIDRENATSPDACPEVCEEGSCKDCSSASCDGSGGCEDLHGDRGN